MASLIATQNIFLILLCCLHHPVPLFHSYWTKNYFKKLFVFFLMTSGYFLQSHSEKRLIDYPRLVVHWGLDTSTTKLDGVFQPLECGEHWQKKRPSEVVTVCCWVVSQWAVSEINREQSLCGVKMCMDSTESACLNVQEQRGEPNSVLGSIDFVLGICKCQTH